MNRDDLPPVADGSAGSSPGEPTDAATGEVARSLTAGMSPEALFKRLLGQSGWLLSANALALVLNFVQGIVVARLLGPSDLGIVALVTAFVAVVGQITDSRAWESAIKYVSEFRAKGDVPRATAMVKLTLLVDGATGTLAFLLVLLLAQVASSVFLDGEVGPELVRLYSLSLLLYIPLGTASALVRLAGRVRWLGYQPLAQAAIRAIGVVIVAALGGGVTAVLLVYLGSVLVGVLVLVVLARRVWPGLGLDRIRSTPLGALRGHRRRIGGFLAATNVNALLKLAQRSVDVLIVGAKLGPAPAGYLRVARTTTDLIAFPTGAIYSAMYPEFVALWHEDRRRELRHFAGRITVLTSIVAVLGVAVVVLFAPQIVQITVGEAFLPAVPVVRWLAVGVGLAVVTLVGHPLLLTMGRPGTSLVAMACGVAAQLVVLLALIEGLGIEAAGIAYVVFYLVWSAIVVPVVWKELR